MLNYILVTGGNGYVGSVLVKKLLKKKFKVIIIDTNWFGNFTPKHKNLIKIKANINNINNLKLKKKISTIIHLSSIANDPMADLDKNLSWETSVLGTLELMNFAIKNKISRIIYASSGSVYGIKKEKKVTEKLNLKPISLYNKVKMCAERIILSFNNIEKFILRPATICGYSPRMRYDLTVNNLTIDALRNKIIKVYGGSQIRPSVHIDDITDLCIKLLTVPKNKQGIYNVGYENYSILKIAKIVQKIIPSKITVIKDISDLRSYKLDSDKIFERIKFFPKKNIETAVIELKKKYENGKLKNNPKFYSVKWLKHLYKRKLLF